jgi:ribonuclease BN (tRNA processing enzyme)
MKLVLLGTGGYYANERRHTACLMLPEVGVVLDAGSGMFRVSDYLATGRLDIFLTHAHLDHVLGLTYLLDVLPPEVLEQTTVHGEAKKLDTIRTHLFSEALFPIMPAFQLKALTNSVALSNGGTLTHFPLGHPGGSLGFRLDWPGSSMAYVTDTTAAADADYIDRIHGTNVLVHEAYFTNDTNEIAKLTGHSCLCEVARVAAAAKVGKLLVVHVNPQLDQDSNFDLSAARQIFRNTQLGTDRMEIEF